MHTQHNTRQYKTETEVYGCVALCPYQTTIGKTKKTPIHTEMWNTHHTKSIPRAHHTQQCTPVMELQSLADQTVWPFHILIAANHNQANLFHSNYVLLTTLGLQCNKTTGYIGRHIPIG